MDEGGNSSQNKAREWVAHGYAVSVARQIQANLTKTLHLGRERSGMSIKHNDSFRNYTKTSKIHGKVLC